MSKAENFKIKHGDINYSSYKEIYIMQKFIFWVDNIPDVKTSSNAIFARPFNDQNAIPQRLTGEKVFI